MSRRSRTAVLCLISMAFALTAFVVGWRHLRPATLAQTELWLSHPATNTVLTGTDYQVLSSFHNHAVSLPPQYADRDAYEVYAAIFGRQCDAKTRSLDWENWGCDVRGASPLLIRNETVKPTDCKAKVTTLDASVTTALDDWATQNKTQWLLNEKLPIPLSNVFISADELNSFFGRPAATCGASPREPNKSVCSWEAFRKQHPNSRGWVEVSAVGFDKARNVAVVYVARYCGGTCGRGFIQVLRKSSGVWKPIRNAIDGCSWIS